MSSDGKLIGAVEGHHFDGIKRNTEHKAPGDGAQSLSPKPEGFYFHPAAGAAATWTLVTGTALDSALSPISVGDAFEFSILNNSANTVTLAINTGITAIEGTDVVLAVATNTAGRFALRKTAAATYKLYRMGAGSVFA